eukprot:4860749-Ditylum_brightwellii.AAC.1
MSHGTTSFSQSEGYGAPEHTHTITSLLLSTHVKNRNPTYVRMDPTYKNEESLSFTRFHST